METNTPKSSVGKQLLGGVMGMAIAGSFYFIASTLSTSSLTGLLVDTPTISEHANQIRVNDKTITEAELRLIASRARQVAALQGAETERALTELNSEAAGETIVTRTAERLEARRRFADDGTPVVDTATVARNNEAMHGGAPRKEVTAEFVPSGTVDAVTPTSTALPNSGFGTSALMVLAIVGAVGVMRKKIFGRA